MVPLDWRLSVQKGSEQLIILWQDMASVECDRYYFHGRINWVLSMKGFRLLRLYYKQLIWSNILLKKLAPRFLRIPLKYHWTPINSETLKYALKTDMNNSVGWWKFSVLRSIVKCCLLMYSVVQTFEISIQLLDKRLTYMLLIYNGRWYLCLNFFESVIGFTMPLLPQRNIS